ncbi:hypothetical protein NP233_g4190 [Leucocoprinus birnbaumii]|uniref:RCC1/BLIP-II protein n=1 Tax=Leucocoprinus birnbaumii TaxID=56174 RepID=A0AAD5YXE2_9AGAR|nr:hypothetical protein NP233_g4190 [Leucocoprinus birnbaumii]
MLNLLSAGSNAQGQLGNTTVDDSSVFQACSFHGQPAGNLPPNVTDIAEVANGANHSLLLLKTRIAQDTEATELWGCGDGRMGQLGPGLRQQEPITSFHKVALDTALAELGLDKYTIHSVSATWETSYLIAKKSGCHDVILSFGSNEFGDLGIGRDAGDKGIEKGVGIHIVDFSHVSVAGNSIKSAKTVTVEKMRSGQRHIIVSLKVIWDEEPVQILVGWGACRHGQLGDVKNLPSQPSSKPLKAKSKKPIIPSPPTYCSRPILVYHSINPSDLVVEYSLGIHHSAFLHSSGRISAKGSDRKNQVQGLESIHIARDVKCTWNGTCVLTGDASPCVLSTGSNSHGQLGRTDNSTTMKVDDIPIANAPVKALACGSEHTLVIMSVDGKGDEVWGWGWNEHGNLGVGNTADSPTPQRIWPPLDSLGTYRILNVWGGNGSSWILYEVQEAQIENSY